MRDEERDLKNKKEAVESLLEEVIGDINNILKDNIDKQIEKARKEDEEEQSGLERTVKDILEIQLNEVEYWIKTYSRDKKRLTELRTLRLQRQELKEKLENIGK